ncbi:hypothetical protein LTR37_017071 [Vermiconidia calcicola]|uniref:Uncharacterized protein n=1 Tax=Vermiconidia calcicola TaxID=1690605 RepID=A0ACC3ML02_9PEZI|nr:hypothetical protein LTR37_017071 [Vermiconidia calcicola]
MPTAATSINNGPTHAEQASPFFKLAGEVRNDVYRFCLTSELPVDVAKGLVARTVLLRVCKQIRSEAESIFYGENTFRITYINQTRSKYAMAWADTLSRENASRLPRLIIKLKLSKALKKAIDCFHSHSYTPAIRQVAVKGLTTAQVSVAEGMSSIVAALRLPLCKVKLEKPTVGEPRKGQVEDLCQLFADMVECETRHRLKLEPMYERVATLRSLHADAVRHQQECGNKLQAACPAYLELTKVNTTRDKEDEGKRGSKELLLQLGGSILFTVCFCWWFCVWLQDAMARAF